MFQLFLAGIGNSGAGFLSGFDGAGFSVVDSGNLHSFNFDRSNSGLSFTRLNQALFKLF